MYFLNYCFSTCCLNYYHRKKEKKKKKFLIITNINSIITHHYFDLNHELGKRKVCVRNMSGVIWTRLPISWKSYIMEKILSASRIIINKKEKYVNIIMRHI